MPEPVIVFPIIFKANVATLKADLARVQGEFKKVQTQIVKESGALMDVNARLKEQVLLQRQITAEKKKNALMNAGPVLQGANLKDWRRTMASAGSAIIAPDVGSINPAKIAMGYKNLGRVLNDVRLASGATEQSIRGMNDGTSSYFGTLLSRSDKALVKMGYLGNSFRNVAMRVENMGKQMQWTGRQMMVGLTLPIILFGKSAIDSFMSLNKEFTRTKMLIGTTEFNAVEGTKNDIKEMANETARLYGISNVLAAGVQADFAAMGYSAKQFGQLTREVFEVSLRGDVEVDVAKDFFRNTMQIFAVGQNGAKNFGDALNQTKIMMAQFNVIEKETSINVRDLAEAMPVAAANASLFGLSAAELGAVLAGMHERGVDAKEGANALKFVLQRIITPTKKASDAFKEMGFNVEAINAENNGIDRIIKLSEVMDQLQKSPGGDSKIMSLFGELGGNRQIARFISALDEVRLGKEQIKEAIAAANAQGEIVSEKNLNKFAPNANAFAKAMLASGAVLTVKEQIDAMNKSLLELSAKQIEIRVKSPEVQFAILRENFKQFMQDIGQALLPSLIKIGQQLSKMAKAFKEMPQWVKQGVAAIALFLAAIGPVVYIGAMFTLAFGTIAKGITSILPKTYILNKALSTSEKVATAAGGGYTLIGDKLVKTRGGFLGFIQTLKLKGAADAKDIVNQGQVSSAYAARGKAAQVASAAAIAANDAETASVIRLKQAANGGWALEGLKRPMPSGGITPIPTMGSGSWQTRKPITLRNIVNKMDEDDNPISEALRKRLELSDVLDIDIQDSKGYLKKEIQELNLGKQLSDELEKTVTVLPPLKRDALGRFLPREHIVPPKVVDAGKTAAKVEDELTDAVSTGAKRAGKKKGLFGGLLAGLGSIIPIGGGSKIQAGITKMFSGLTPGGAGGITQLMTKVPILGKAFAAAGIAAASGGSGIAAFTGAIGSALAPIAAIIAAAVAVVAAIGGIVAVAAAVSGYWNNFVNGLKSGWNDIIDSIQGFWGRIEPSISALKDAFVPLIQAFREIGKIATHAFAELFGASDKGAKGSGKHAEKMAKSWTNVGQIMGGVLTGIANVINWTANAIAVGIRAFAAFTNAVIVVSVWVGEFSGAFSFLKNLFNGIADVIGVIASIMQGDFANAFAYARRLLFDLAAVAAVPFDVLVRAAAMAAVVVLQVVENIAEGIDAVLGGNLEDPIKRVRKEAQKMTQGDFLGDKIREWRSNIKVKPVFKTSDAKKDAKDAGKGIRDKAIEGLSGDEGGGGGEEEEAAESIFSGFLNALKSNLDKVMAEFREAVEKSFAAMWDTRLKVFDNQIKAIDDLIEAEQRLTAAQEYQAKRRELIANRELDRENYRRNRALAVYEGRTDDARMLDLNFQASDRDATTGIKDLDKDRRQALIDQQREDKKKEIGVAKEAAEEMRKIQEDQLKGALDLIFKYTPQSVAAWNNMTNQINATLRNYGIPSITSAFTDGLGVFIGEIGNTKTQMLNDAFWNGKLPASLIMGNWISVLTGIPVGALFEAGKKASDAFGAGTEAGKMGDNDKKDSSKPRTFAPPPRKGLNYATSNSRLKGGVDKPTWSAAVRVVPDNRRRARIVAPKEENNSFQNMKEDSNQIKQTVKHDIKHIYKHINKKTNWERWAGMKIRKTIQQHAAHKIHHKYAQINKRTSWEKWPGMKVKKTSRLISIHNIRHQYKHLNKKTNWERWPGMKVKKTMRHVVQHEIQHQFLHSGVETLGVEIVKTIGDVMVLFNKEIEKGLLGTVVAFANTWQYLASRFVPAIFNTINNVVSMKMVGIHSTMGNRLNSMSALWKLMLGILPRVMHETMSAVLAAAESGFNNLVAKTIIKVGAVGAAWNRIKQAFWEPISKVIGAGLIPFALQLTAMGIAAGIPSGTFPVPTNIPQFHTGGIADESGTKHPGNKLAGNEMLAVLQKGEGILPKKAMSKIGGPTFEALREGKVPGTGDGPLVNPGARLGAGSGNETRMDFAKGFLSLLGAPHTNENFRALLAWMQAEGTAARYNPLATTNKHPGSTTFNSHGVQNFQTFVDGLYENWRALATSHHRNYDNIIASLRQGTSAQQTLTFLANSPWGTGALALRVLGSDPANISGVDFGAGGGGAAPGANGGALIAGLDKIMGDITATGVEKTGVGKIIAGMAKHFGNIVKMKAATFSGPAAGPGGGFVGGGMPIGGGVKGSVDDITAWRGRVGSYEALIRWMNASGVPFRVTSAVRPGAITADGNLSHHAMARAVDFDGPDRMAIWKAFTPIATLLSDLIYSPAPWNVDAGRIVPVSYWSPATRANHYDHVHASLAKGGVVKKTPGGVHATVAEGAHDEAVLPLPGGASEFLRLLTGLKPVKETRIPSVHRDKLSHRFIESLDSVGRALRQKFVPKSTVTTPELTHLKPKPWKSTSAQIRAWSDPGPNFLSGGSPDPWKMPTIMKPRKYVAPKPVPMPVFRPDPINESVGQKFPQGTPRSNGIVGPPPVEIVENFTLNIDTAIGDPKWFKEQLDEWAKTTKPARDRARGTMNRTVSSYQSGNLRSGR